MCKKQIQSSPCYFSSSPLCPCVSFQNGNTTCEAIIKHLECPSPWTSILCAGDIQHLSSVCCLLAPHPYLTISSSSPFPPPIPGSGGRCLTYYSDINFPSSHLARTCGFSYSMSLSLYLTQYPSTLAMLPHGCHLC